jgi:signal transduction histidine kinase
MKILNKKYAVMITVLFLLLTILGCSLINNNRDSRVNYVLEQHLKTLETYYKVLSHKQKIIADETFKETINNKQLITILKQANIAYKNKDFKSLDTLREKAKNLLTFKYNILKIKGVLQYHFVFPDNSVFLRMHKPSKFGDNLTRVRLDFDKTNKTRTIVRGFSQGRTAHGFRNVYPILTDNDSLHLGAFEVSFSSEYLQDYLTEMNQLHTHFIVNKSIFKSHTWQRDDLVLKYTQSAEDNNHMLTIGPQHSHEKCIIENSLRIDSIKKELKEKLAIKKAFALFTEFKDVTSVIAFYPIEHSVTKDVVAWLVSYKPNNIINDIEKNALLTKILVITFVGIASFFIYFLMTQRLLLNKTVEEKTKNLQKINKELEEKENDLEHINENLEEIIQKEINKNKEKDRMLFEQSKMASMGEMIGNIAHQWRQPLSAISTSASSMIMQNDLDILQKDEINKQLELIISQSQYLSTTIDDFRDFIRGDSKKENIKLSTITDSFLNLVSSSIKKHEINFINKVNQEIKFEALPNELNQCFINLFNNTKDAFKPKAENKIIILDAILNDNEVIISFQDNAGGIPENIIDKIFEPYFTTKHQSQGTGLGLHMVYKMIVEGMKGSISVENQNFTFKDRAYKGALFIIKIPLN